MNDMYLFEQGSIAVIETATNTVHGPFDCDDDALAELYLLEQQGVHAVAVQMIGENNV